MELNREQIVKQMQEWSDNMCENACLKGESLNGKVHTCEICFPNTVKNALSLIKELTEVVERSETAQGCKESVNNGFSPSVTELQRENERLQKALNTDISIVRVSRGSGKTAHLREVGRIKIDAIRADTVRKMHSEIKKRCIEGGIYPAFVASTIDQIAKEMLEVAERREGVEESPVDSSTPSVTDQKGEGK